MLGNTKLRNILDLTLEDGEIVKKNKYVTDDDFLELIKKKKGLFTMDHVDEVQFEKLSTEFPIFKQLATYNTNSGLIKSMKSYISKNQNSKDPIIQNKIKKQIEFLQDLKLRIDTPTGRVGSKEVLAAVDRKAGILPNFLAQLKALDIRIPSKAKAALYVIGGIGASTLAQAEEVSKTPFPGIKPEGSPRQINPEKEEEGFTTGEKLAGAGVAGGAYAARKPILKTLGKIARPVGRVLGAPSLAGGLALSELLSDDPNLGVAGADLLLPELTKQAGVRGVLANPFQLAEKASKFGKIGRGIASIARAPSMFTPIGLGLMGIEGVRMGMREQDRINEMRMNEPDKYEEYLDELESYGDFSA